MVKRRVPATRLAGRRVPAQRYSALGGVANARLDLFGAELETFMKRAARGYTRITMFGEPNPTYTIFALSLRGAEKLKPNWSTVAG